MTKRGIEDITSDLVNFSHDRPAGSLFERLPTEIAPMIFKSLTVLEYAVLPLVCKYFNAVATHHYNEMEANGADHSCENWTNKTTTKDFINHVTKMSLESAKEYFHIIYCANPDNEPGWDTPYIYYAHVFENFFRRGNLELVVISYKYLYPLLHLPGSVTKPASKILNLLVRSILNGSNFAARAIETLASTYSAYPCMAKIPPSNQTVQYPVFSMINLLRDYRSDLDLFKQVIKGKNLAQIKLLFANSTIHHIHHTFHAPNIADILFALTLSPPVNMEVVKFVATQLSYNCWTKRGSGNIMKPYENYIACLFRNSNDKPTLSTLTDQIFYSAELPSVNVYMENVIIENNHELYEILARACGFSFYVQNIRTLEKISEKISEEMSIAILDNDKTEPMLNLDTPSVDIFETMFLLIPIYESYINSSHVSPHGHNCVKFENFCNRLETRLRLVSKSMTRVYGQTPKEHDLYLKLDAMIRKSIAKLQQKKEEDQKTKRKCPICMQEYTLATHSHLPCTN